MGLEASGIYMTAIFMVMVIEMPRRFVGEISAPIIAEAFGTGNLTSINEHYKKASINLFLLGGIIYVLIIINLVTNFLFAYLFFGVGIRVKI